MAPAMAPENSAMAPKIAPELARENCKMTPSMAPTMVPATSRWSLKNGAGNGA